MSIPNSPSQTRRPVMMAVVLGAALAALGTTENLSASEVSNQNLGGISRYCTACWRNARLPIDRWGDCTQEVFARLLERVPLSSWCRLLTGEGAERREFLRAIDTVKKRHQRERAKLLGLNDPVPDTHDTQARIERDQHDALVQAAGRVLSPRQQEIVRLICDGHSVGDIASELAISPDRVSDEKYKAVLKLRAYFEVNPDAA